MVAGFVLLKIDLGKAGEAEAALGLAAEAGLGAGAVALAAGVAAAQEVVQRVRASQEADPAVEVTPGARAAQSLGAGPGPPGHTLNPAAGADPGTGTCMTVPKASHQLRTVTTIEI